MTAATLAHLPLQVGGEVKGALVFVRFGGPRYEQEHLNLALLSAEILSLMLERQAWRKMNEELRALRMQMQLQEDFVIEDRSTIDPCANGRSCGPYRFEACLLGAGAGAGAGDH